MKVSDAAISLIKTFEGLRTVPYNAVPTEKYLSIGYGHYGPDVKENDVITKDGAEALLKKDLVKFESSVTAMLDVKEISVTQSQFDALVCFAYNVGLSALESSTLMKKLDEGNYAAAANEFLRWNKAGGKELEGLTRRREAERRLFLAKL